MDNTKHTPGPWEWVPGEYGYSTLWNPETRQEVITTGGRNEGDYPATWMGEEMSDADKALIVAAPDLLAELKGWLRDSDGWSLTELRKRYDEKTVQRILRSRTATVKAEVRD